jgi:hypothetical protein
LDRLCFPIVFPDCVSRLCFPMHNFFFQPQTMFFGWSKKKIHRWAIDKRNMFHLFIGYFCSIFWIDCVSRCIIFFFSLKRCFSAGQKKKIHRWAIDKRNMFHLFIGYFCSIFWIDCISRCIIFFSASNDVFRLVKKKNTSVGDR